MKAGKIKTILLLTGIMMFCGAFIRKKLPAMDPCLVEVKTIYDQMYTKLPEEGKVCRFSYRISSTLNTKDKSGNNIINSSDIDLYSTKDQYRFISKDISVYQDKLNKFTILPAQKMIYWADSDMGLVKGDHLGRMKKMQDTIFSYADIVDCKSVQQEHIDKIISVKLRKKFAEYIQVKQVTYYLDSKHKNLRRMQIDYPANKEVLTLDFIFNELDYDYKKIILGNIKPLFISGKNNLTASYKQYKLVDVRKKK